MVTTTTGSVLKKYVEPVFGNRDRPRPAEQFEAEFHGQVGPDLDDDAP
jgi:hypothetical protein